MKYFLGIKVEQSEKWIFICQNKYARDLLKRFRMENWKHVPTPTATCTKLNKDDERWDVNPTLFKRLVGNLMYITATRPDIMQGVSLISRFMERPKDTHWRAGKRIGYIDSDFAGSLDDRKRTFGYVFHLGSGVISWVSKKKPIVTLSSAKS